nr:immunoglobulin heavy chain junction region [Macaca mulatta]MOV48831.1 immunoglobulin heavy chain junction region [Macaca mulatta]MOV49185.1 immunoglobulin heavy chain junction region [Macaca mulatta]MOV49295.1 immunoglobulin heavy chain junction region [Macaca mulatta]MOV49467.1 immunoglobulin heavy chain junction region [Macaca mulatta]
CAREAEGIGGTAATGVYGQW